MVSAQGRDQTCSRVWCFLRGVARHDDADLHAAVRVAGVPEFDMVRRARQKPTLLEAVRLTTET
jgi:hypothetical protein